jgi:endoglucanase
MAHQSRPAHGAAPIRLRGWPRICTFSTRHFQKSLAQSTLRGIDYVLGTHPASNVSYVSSVGTQSKLIAYGNNRADYTFVPGGMIPGVVIIQPDFPELKDSWPFLWYENEYVIDAVTNFILAANAANALAN